jgi:hypothetical protein
MATDVDIQGEDWDEDGDGDEGVFGGADDTDETEVMTV